jgi:hypothetical protein
MFLYVLVKYDRTLNIITRNTHTHTQTLFEHVQNEVQCSDDMHGSPDV